MTAAQDEFLRRLVVAGFLALGRLAPGRRPVLATIGTTAIRVVDWVAGDAARDRALALPAGAASLADDFVDMVRIGYGAHSRHAFRAHHAGLARLELQKCITLIAAGEHRISAGGTRKLAALAGFRL